MSVWSLFFLPSPEIWQRSLFPLCSIRFAWSIQQVANEKCFINKTPPVPQDVESSIKTTVSPTTYCPSHIHLYILLLILNAYVKSSKATPLNPVIPSWVNTTHSPTYHQHYQPLLPLSILHSLEKAFSAPKHLSLWPSPDQYTVPLSHHSYFPFQ